LTVTEMLTDGSVSEEGDVVVEAGAGYELVNAVVHVGLD
jgi:hypothetical protein